MAEKIVANPNHYKPVNGETYMNDKQLAHFKNRLTEWRDLLLLESGETVKHLQNENLQEPDPTDRASVETDAALELRTRDRYRKLITKIDAALLRIKNNKYGYCDISGEEIGILRLNARPIATMTLESQQEHENYEDTHLDDEVRF